MGDHSKSNPKFVSELLGLPRSAHLTQQLPPVCPSSGNDSHESLHSGDYRSTGKLTHCNFAYSALASFKIGTLGSASFQSEEIFVGGECPDAGGVHICS